MRRELKGLSRVELVALAGAEGIRRRHRLTKAELVDALVAAYRRLVKTPRAFRSLKRKDLLVLARALSIRPRSRLTKMKLAEAVFAKWGTRRMRGAGHSLPSGYGRTHLTLMPIDPYRLHAYWEIVPADLEAARRALGDEGKAASTVLRTYDVSAIIFDGTNAWHTFDVEVGAATNWYVSLWSPGKSLLAEVGLRSGTGHFVPVARSNIAHTPRAGPADRWEEPWGAGGPVIAPILESPPVGDRLAAARGDLGTPSRVVPPSPSPSHATGDRCVSAQALSFDGGRMAPAQGEGTHEAPGRCDGPFLRAAGGAAGRFETPGLTAWRSMEGTWVTSPGGPAPPSPEE